MRKISTFSAKMQVSDTAVISRNTFSETEPKRVAESTTTPEGEVSVFMTPSLVKMTIRELKRSINIRFLQLVKSCKQFAKSARDPEDLRYLQKFMVMNLTMMLGEYVDMLQTNPSLQLPMYLNLSSVAPQAMNSARKLSRVMILANRIRQSTGILPPKNQRDLNKAMDDFISDIVGIATNPVNVKNPLLNTSLQK